MSTCPPEDRIIHKPIETDRENPNFPLFVSMLIRNGVGLSRKTVNAILTTFQYQGINPVQGLKNHDGNLVTIEDLQNGFYTNINPVHHEQRIENAGYANDPIERDDWTDEDLAGK